MSIRESVGNQLIPGRPFVNSTQDVCDLSANVAIDQAVAKQRFPIVEYLRIEVAHCEREGPIIFSKDFRDMGRQKGSNKADPFFSASPRVGDAFQSPATFKLGSVFLTQIGPAAVLARKMSADTPPDNSLR
jgi:hypothetical protein